MQGVILGGLIQGIKVENGAFAGGAFDWATPFALLCGLGVVAGYALLGATWLVDEDRRCGRNARTRTGEMAAGRRARLHGAGQPVDAARVPAHRRALVQRAQHLFPLADPAGHRCHRFMAWRWLDAGRDVLPFFATIALFLLGYLGLAISTYPYLVPPSLTVWDTAAAPASQIFIAGRHARAAAGDPRLLCRVRLLDLPRQGARRRGLSLVPRTEVRTQRAAHSVANFGFKRGIRSIELLASL